MTTSEEYSVSVHQSSLAFAKRDSHNTAKNNWQLHWAFRGSKRGTLMDHIWEIIYLDYAIFCCNHLSKEILKNKISMGIDLELLSQYGYFSYFWPNISKPLEILTKTYKGS